MSRAQRGSTEVFTYFQVARQHYSTLGIGENDDEAYLRYLGCSKHLKKNMHSNGIRSIYKKVLELIAQNHTLRTENQQLKEKLHKPV